MGGLVLTLKPYERFLVNGALLENGPRRGQIRLTDPNVSILRLSDALHPNEVTTPVRRVYYAAQLILSGDVREDVVKPEIIKNIENLRGIFEKLPEVEALDKALKSVENGRYYSVLCSLKSLFPVEEAILLRRRANDLEEQEAKEKVAVA